MRSKKLTAGVALAASGVVALLLAAFATGASQSQAQAPVGSGKASKTKSICGAGTGKKATGSADQDRRDRHVDPGRGLHDHRQGRQGVLRLRQRQRRHQRPADPVHALQRAAQSGAAGSAGARKLVESDKVVGVVGNTSFTECGTNWKYYRSKGFTVIGAGVQAECFGMPSFVETNMGPRYSTIGAAQALVKRGAKSIVVASPSTIAAYADGGVIKVATAAGIPCRSFRSSCP